MKNSKRVFILIESVLGVMVILLVFIMIREKDEKAAGKVSVIVQNSEDNQWLAFKYGLKMAAEDWNIELSVVSTGGQMTTEEEKSMIESEIDNGADAVIVQPVSEAGAEKMLRNIEKKVPLMLIAHTASRNKETSQLPTTEPDNYEMGKALAKGLLKDYDENIAGKTLGIISENADSEATINRKKGFVDALKGRHAEIKWSVSGVFAGTEAKSLEMKPRVDCVIALDDTSLIIAGQYSAARNLHGALVYGIGNSMEAVYYLDTDIVKCLVVPDEFNVGYQSLTEVAKRIGHFFHKIKNHTVSYSVIRRDTLFSKENQEIIFTMSQ